MIQSDAPCADGAFVGTVSNYLKAVIQCRPTEMFVKDLKGLSATNHMIQTQKAAMIDAIFFVELMIKIPHERDCCNPG